MKKVKWIRFGLCLAVAALYAAGWFFCQGAKEGANLTYLVLSRSIDAAAAEEIFRQEQALEDPVGFCFWGEAEAKTVICQETGGTAQVTCVFLSGNPGVMGAGDLAWQEGCLLDEATARQLFGTSQCGGQILRRGDTPYSVLRTISSALPTMLTVAERKDGAVLNRCVLSVPAENGKQAAEQFMLRWGLQGEVIDFYTLWVFLHNFLLLIPGIFLLSKAREMKKRPILRIAAGLLLLFLGSRIILLPGMLPSRWSDFSFWGSALEAQVENFYRLLLPPMGERQLQMMLDMVKSILSSTAAGFLALWVFGRQTYADTAD